MNKERKAELKRAAELINDARVIVETIADEVQAEFDELSERAQEGERGQQMETDASTLNDAVGYLESVDLSEFF